ncbi:hypothetical protein [Oligoflexus tunisiensis]|uniref:hypothetical protein n=1 Tax=Oligoflexus tunisiensis TaxID=708132 RepID=UPI00114CA068|nr:hypothetical protein [Oligoflexus tunisiensis]
MRQGLLKWILSLVAGLSFSQYAAASATCTWRQSKVFSGEWLECTDCVWRFCQCQDNGSWGNCTNDPPPQACDWNNPDWSNPACSEGGFKPCDWNQPDWNNPACNAAHPGGVPNQNCASCHPNGIPPRRTDPGDSYDALLSLGKDIYERSCQGCHKPMPNSTKRGRTAAQIEAAKPLHTRENPTWVAGFKSKALELYLK